MTISKTTITFTVLHVDGELPESLEDILAVSDYGNAVGAVTKTTVEAVADDEVHDELIALGNDGEFFAQEDEE